MSITAPSRWQTRRALLAATLCLVSACCCFFNNTVGGVFSSGRFDFHLDFLSGLPMSASSFGMDGLRLVHHARQLRQDRHFLRSFSTPPESAMASPLLFWLVMPLHRMDDRTAFLWIASVTSFALCAAIWLGGVSGSWVHKRGPVSGLIACFAALLMSFMCFSSYPYFFAVERGNWHGIEVFCSMGACATLILRPRWVLLQALLLAMAVHMKIYPLVLLPLFVLARGWKFLAWFLVCYVPGLLSWGMEHFIAYVTKVREFAGRASGGPWAHDATTWSLWITQIFAWDPHWVSWIAKGVPTLLWSLAVYLVYRGKTRASFLLLYVNSVILMSVMQTLSWDYKLVIVFPALAAFTAFVLDEYIVCGGMFDLLLLVTVILVAGLLTRNPGLPSAIVVKNKFLLLIALQLVFLLKHAQSLVVSPVQPASYDAHP